MSQRIPGDGADVTEFKKHVIAAKLVEVMKIQDGKILKSVSANSDSQLLYSVWNAWIVKGLSRFDVQLGIEELNQANEALAKAPRQSSIVKP